MVLGGPGCGKTTIALLKALEHMGHLEEEQRILFLSFSRAAVRQVVTRMSELLDYRARQTIEVRTFHAFFLDVLRSHGRLLTGKPVAFITPERESLRKADHDDPWPAERERMAREDSVFVFDTLAPFAAELLETCADVRRLYCARYPLIIVDEFQDTNVDQWRVVRSLAEWATVVCLADPDQRIYGHLEGVDEHRLDDARTALTPRTFDLSADNHRSPTSGLLEYANAVLRNSPASPPKDLVTWTYRDTRTLETVVHQAVVALRAALVSQGVGGVPPTIAVLTRANALAARISEALEQEQVDANGDPLPAVDHTLEWDPELTAMSALVVASILEWPRVGRANAVVRTLRRIADFYRTKVARGVQGARSVLVTLERAVGAIEAGGNPASKTGKVLLERNVSLPELVGDPVRDWQVARDVLRGSRELEEVSKQARLVRMLRSTDALGWGLLDAWDGAVGYRDAAEVVRIALAEEAVSVSQQATPAVSVMTMHKSKGKEFDAVILVEGRYGWDPFLGEDPSDHPADRRLLRVAITRARHFVLLVRPFERLALTPSP